MGYVHVLNNDRIAAEVQNFQFKPLPSPLPFNSFQEITNHLLAENASSDPQPVGVAARVEKLTQHLDSLSRGIVSDHDPAAQLLKHYSPTTHTSPSATTTTRDNIRYVSPSSIQSSQSPAAYLAHIYKLTLNHFEADLDVMSLSTRRPDLADFELSQHNLEQQITTLELANELLIRRILEDNAYENEENLFNSLKSTVYPLALPFHREFTFVRQSLDQVSHLSLNEIAYRSTQNAFAFDHTRFTLVPNVADCLNLDEELVALLKQTPKYSTLYEEWFGLDSSLTAEFILREANNYCTSTDLSFQELRQFLRDDCHVSDEDGKPHANMYACFFHHNWVPELVITTAGTYTIQTENPEGEPDLFRNEIYETQNKCIRLKRRTGLPFYQLDWLLFSANETSKTPFDYTHLLDFLAHYAEWNKRFNMVYDEFAALFFEINCYNRHGCDEKTLMKRLFGSDAPVVTRISRRDPGKRVRIDAIKDGEYASMLAKGFRLTSTEWKIVVALVTADHMSYDFLDHLVMSRIYRLVTVFRLLKWGVLPGLALTSKVNPSLLDIIARSNDSADVLSALDKLVWMNEWMTGSGLTPADLSLAATGPSDVDLSVKKQTLIWVEQFQDALTAARVTASDFLSFEKWFVSEKDCVTIKGAYWIQALETKHMIDGHGLLMAEEAALELAILDILKENGVDLDMDSNKEKMVNLCHRLENERERQNNILVSQLTKYGINYPSNTSFNGWAAPTTISWPPCCHGTLREILPTRKG